MRHECKHCSADHLDDLHDAERTINNLNDTLTRCQAECTRLLEENRELKAKAAEGCPDCW